MILNPNDPSGFGLFSKCARNHASKIKPHNPSASGRLRPKTLNDDPSRKKAVTHSGFSKQQSRDQRQRKYKKEQAPPVGKYNPVIKPRPKLVWDILKAFHRNHKPRLERATVPEPQTTVVQTEEASVQELQGELQGVESYQKQHNLQTSITGERSSAASAVSRSQCMVDMSRMTGRKDRPIEVGDIGQSDVLQSLGYVKGKVSRNIYFDRMPKQKERRYGTINYSTNYDCNYELVHTKRRALLDFGVVRGRGDKMKTDHEYSYQHYNYDGYVWEGESKVFPNTKTHLISFEKQRDRYGGSERGEPA